MVNYEVIVERKAHKDVARLPSTVYGRVFRIIYDVDDDRREVFITEVWHRQRGYR